MSVKVTTPLPHILHRPAGASQKNCRLCIPLLPAFVFHRYEKRSHGEKSGGHQQRQPLEKTDFPSPV